MFDSEVWEECIKCSLTYFSALAGADSHCSQLACWLHTCDNAKRRLLNHSCDSSNIADCHHSPTASYRSILYTSTSTLYPVDLTVLKHYSTTTFVYVLLKDSICFHTIFGTLKKIPFIMCVYFKLLKHSIYFF